MGRKINGYTIFSGYTFLIILWITFYLSTIENKLGWGSQYNAEVINYLPIYVIYTVFFLLGMYIGKYKKGEYIKSRNTYISTLNTNIVFCIVLFFMILKFINIRDIPLFGDPMSRYNYTLGGFADYPARFLPVMAISSFLLYKDINKRIYLYYVILAVVLPMLLMQRQDVVIGILGITIAVSFTKSFTMGRIIKYAILIFISILLLVGGGSVLRYGSEQLSSSLEIYDLLFAVLHGDLTGATLLGAHVSDSIDTLYYGMYSLGEYISIFSFDKIEHGAELIRVQFTDSETAQSIALPFSFYIDFSYFGVAFFALISGFVLVYLKYKYLRSNKMFYLIIYILFFLELFWSLRSGTIPFKPMFLYQYAVLYFFLMKQNTIYYRYVISPIVIGTFFISLSSAIIRF